MLSFMLLLFAAEVAMLTLACASIRAAIFIDRDW